MRHPAQGSYCGSRQWPMPRDQIVTNGAGQTQRVAVFCHVCRWLALIGNLQQTKPCAFRDGLVTIVYP